MRHSDDWKPLDKVKVSMAMIGLKRAWDLVFNKMNIEEEDIKGAGIKLEESDLFNEYQEEKKRFLQHFGGVEKFELGEH